jgi:sialate O-acetylesterase
MTEMNKPINQLFIISLLIFLLPQFLQANIKLPVLISDGMVLQRDAKLIIWGWASPGEKVQVKFVKKTISTLTDSEGNWKIAFPPMKAGGPYIMEVKGNNTITINDILVGDVWFCSGQSNMVLNMERVKEKYPEDIANANFPDIRNFYIPTASDVTSIHKDLPPGRWVSASPENVPGFGAVTFFFARSIYREYKVPIGIINSSVGGTPIEAWTSEEGLMEFPRLKSRIEKLKDTAYLNPIIRSSGRRLETIQRPADNSNSVDKGESGSKPWYDNTYVPEGWHKYWFPGYWDDQGVSGLNGIVWFRKEIKVPESMTGMPAKLFLGRIVDADKVYVNGILSGSVTYQYPPRRYNLPSGLLKPGKNIIVIRVTNNTGKGGFVPDKPYYLVAGNDSIDLRGEWLYKVGQVFRPVVSGREAVTPAILMQNEPTGLYNTMVAPLLNYKIKGILWYQGETNTSKPEEYQLLLPALINDWRNKWQQGALPFLFVQLPNFMEVRYLPSESQWAELRYGQLKSLSVPNTAMAVAIDIGEWNDIHPLEKKTVGERLALAARKLAYGDEKIVSSGPIYKSSVKEADRIIIEFDNIGSGLAVKGGGDLDQFAIAGSDRKFVWAEAIIDNNRVIVKSDEIKNPVYVRYAWADNPAGANLYNIEGLPASPFEAGSSGQNAPQAQFNAGQDHQNMMDQLGIKSLRPGPSGNESARNHANYDESIANPYPDLPDLLTLKNGKKVTTPAIWWKQRRPEIAEDLEKEVYGRLPNKVPAVKWTVDISEREMVGFIPVIAKKLTGHVDNSEYPLIDVNISMVLVLPANVKGPVPVLMMFGVANLPAPAQPNRDELEVINQAFRKLLSERDPEVKTIFDKYQAYNPITQVTTVSPFGGLGAQANPISDPPSTQQLLTAGWGYAIINPSSIQADNGAGLTKGIIGLVNKGQPRKPDDWGSLRAWAWGAARGLDYLEADSAVDAKHVGIEGVSRYGKAALVTLAFEERFALALVGSSGKGGATLNRRNFGEAVENLTGTGEYHWMAGNYLKYGAAESDSGVGNAGQMSVDSHSLIAMCAPRLTFISYGIPEKGDAKWLDQKGSYMAVVAAGSVFKLLGVKDIGVSNDYKTEVMPPYNTSMLDGELAWRQHDGGHTDAPNMKYFIEWANRKIGYNPGTQERR